VPIVISQACSRPKRVRHWPLEMRPFTGTATVRSAQSSTSVGTSSIAVRAAKPPQITDITQAVSQPRQRVIGAFSASGRPGKAEAIEARLKRVIPVWHGRALNPGPANVPT
jgi:hypothetical protein